MALPIQYMRRPASLNGQNNGRLDAHLLHPITGGYLLRNAKLAWDAMSANAYYQGVHLNPTSPVDTYRPFSIQHAIFVNRYDHVPRSGTGGRRWYQGLPWWKKWGVATAAVPGTSNHGWALAVDVAHASGARLEWLLAHAWDYGFSWELQSEPWHIRYCLGDDLPASVTAPPPPEVVILGTPVGRVDVAERTAEGKIYIAGWAFDPDDAWESLQIHIYVEGVGPIGVTADQPRPDVNTNMKIPGNHGFVAIVNPVIKNTVRVYAIDHNDPSTNTLLSQVDVEVPV